MNRFRSPLMQQLISSARNNSSPPLALACVSRGLKSLSSGKSSEKQSTIQSCPSVQLPARRHSVTVPSLTSEPESCSETQRKALALQDLIKSRRSVSQLVPYVTAHGFIASAIRRAVECGMHAPNHKRTEPFTFRQMLAPSEATRRLTRICYRVALHRALREKGVMEHRAQLQAQQKARKWGAVPAFLVASVSGQPPQSGPCFRDVYEEHPTIPPASTRQLEDVSLLPSFLLLPLTRCDFPRSTQLLALLSKMYSSPSMPKVWRPSGPQGPSFVHPPFANCCRWRKPK